MSRDPFDVPLPCHKPLPSGNPCGSRTVRDEHGQRVELCPLCWASRVTHGVAAASMEGGAG